MQQTTVIRHAKLDIFEIKKTEDFKIILYFYDQIQKKIHSLDCNI